ncbi:MAG: hypothetical protein QOC71_922, partial [Thermoplasmata archaeon]|nr:hypothetical protein [Thermoplasmata archaeon]
ALRNCLLWGSSPIHLPEDYEKLTAAIKPNLKGGAAW